MFVALPPQALTLIYRTVEFGGVDMHLGPDHIMRGKHSYFFRMTLGLWTLETYHNGAIPLSRLETRNASQSFETLAYSLGHAPFINSVMDCF